MCVCVCVKSVGMCEGVWGCSALGVYLVRESILLTQEGGLAPLQRTHHVVVGYHVPRQLLQHLGVGHFLASRSLLWCKPAVSNLSTVRSGRKEDDDGQSVRGRGRQH